MKQHITLKQWDEITRKQKNILWGLGYRDDWKMNIGQMIEFLGDVDRMDRCDVEGGYKAWFVSGEDWRSSGEKELCDAIWEAVKYKLFDKENCK